MRRAVPDARLSLLRQIVEAHGHKPPDTNAARSKGTALGPTVSYVQLGIAAELWADVAELWPRDDPRHGDVVTLAIECIGKASADEAIEGLMRVADTNPEREQSLWPAIIATTSLLDPAERGGVLRQICARAPADGLAEEWTRAFAEALRVEQREHRRELVGLLTPFAPLAVLREALDATLRIGDGASAANLLAALAKEAASEQQRAILRDAVASAATVRDEDDRSVLLSDLALKCDESTAHAALAAARDLSNVSLRISTLLDLAPRLTASDAETAWQLVIDAAASIEQVPVKHSRFEALAPRMPPSALPRFLQIAMTFDDQQVACNIARSAVPLLPAAEQGPCRR
jgi:hypothetical protein